MTISVSRYRFLANCSCVDDVRRDIVSHIHFVVVRSCYRGVRLNKGIGLESRTRSFCL